MIELCACVPAACVVHACVWCLYICMVCGHVVCAHLHCMAVPPSVPATEEYKKVVCEALNSAITDCIKCQMCRVLNQVRWRGVS